MEERVKTYMQIESVDGEERLTNFLDRRGRDIGVAAFTRDPDLTIALLSLPSTLGHLLLPQSTSRHYLPFPATHMSPLPSFFTIHLIFVFFLIHPHYTIAILFLPGTPNHFILFLIIHSLP